jgi:ribonucleotide reductase beta subunit family protein with ferritin-like domain
MLLEENKLFGLYLYPEAKELMEKQQDVFWTAQEIPVDKDINDFKLNMSKKQFNLVSYTLQLFVETEQLEK